jgi:hypothetical protein
MADNLELHPCFYNAPFVPDARIVRQVEICFAAYAARTGKVVELPVPVEEIAEFDLKVRLEYCSPSFFAEGPEVLGAYEFGSGRIFISEHLLSNEGRLRWTIAHEVGHHKLHSGLAKQQTLFDEPVSALKAYRGGFSVSDRLEAQANRFAAHLLLPERLVRAFVGPEGSGIRREDDFKRLALAAAVSQQAASIRLEQLGLVEKTG